jgi:hypothetical protein
VNCPPFVKKFFVPLVNLAERKGKTYCCFGKNIQYLLCFTVKIIALNQWVRGYGKGFITNKKSKSDKNELI